MQITVIANTCEILAEECSVIGDYIYFEYGEELFKVNEQDTELNEIHNKLWVDNIKPIEIVWIGENDSNRF